MFVDNKTKSRQQYISAYRRGRERRKKEKYFTIAIMALFFAMVGGASLAYVLTRTEPVKNTFTHSYVSCEVTETFDGKTKSKVRIRNTGDVQSYIRAKVVVTWMSEDQTKVTARQPVKDSDYEIVYANEMSNWKLSTDGYWYYKVPVDVSEETQDLIDKCVLKEGAKIPDGFYLSVEIVASAIQSTPATVVKEQWSSGVDEVQNTTLLIK